MSTPEYLLCANCETPCYVFEWNSDKGETTEAICQVCGNDEPGEFMTQSDWDDQAES